MAFRCNSSLLGWAKAYGEGPVLGLPLRWGVRAQEMLSGVLQLLAGRGGSHRQPTTEEALEAAENELLAALSHRWAHDYRTVATDSGVWQLHSIEVFGRPPSGDEESVLVVFHGASTGAMTWLPVMDLLAEQYSRVIYLDLPGNGRGLAPEA
eukprot:RCo008913